MTPDQFIERLLWHTPEPRQQSIRYYGRYHPQQHVPRAACRNALGQAPETAPPPIAWSDYLERIGQADSGGCPVCGARLRQTTPLPRQHGPPNRTPYQKAA